MIDTGIILPVLPEVMGLVWRPPKATEDALWKKHKSKLAFPAGFF